jgi:hypothetical protein
MMLSFKLHDSSYFWSVNRYRWEWTSSGMNGKEHKEEEPQQKEDFGFDPGFCVVRSWDLILR